MHVRQYKPLTMRRVNPGTSYNPPAPGRGKPIRMDSPAIEVMTDLSVIPAATIAATASVVQANEAMIARGVRLLLVTGLHGEVEGVVTARDTMGEKPVRILHERGGRHVELSVADVMTPRAGLDAIEIDAVLRSDVGHIVNTLREVGRQHALVVDHDPLSGGERIRGVFSATQIGRQLGAQIETFEVARTFAEIESLMAAG